MKRRHFIKNTPLAAAFYAAGLPPIAGPFLARDFRAPGQAPADKKLDPAWVASLRTRGQATAYAKSRGELAYIGMPCGGIGCGTMYVGGDGRLWLWDIFNDNRNGIDPKTIEWHLPLHVGNTVRAQDGANFVQPPKSDEKRPFAQGFSLTIKYPGGRGSANSRPDLVLSLREDDWAEVVFEAQYPIATIRFSDPKWPVAVRMQVFSPFIPMDEDSSSLPATVFSIEIVNKTAESLRVEVKGWLENAVCNSSNRLGLFEKTNLAIREKNMAGFVAAARPAAAFADKTEPDIVLDDFENGRYDNWTIEGEAFGAEPFRVSELEKNIGKINARGERAVNTYNIRAAKPGENPDDFTGRMQRKPFRIERDFLVFKIGGGAHPGKTGVKMMVDGVVVFDVSGKMQNLMRTEIADLRAWRGKEATLEIYDLQKGYWGQVGCDHFVLTDRPPLGNPLDFGSMALVVLAKNGRSGVERADFGSLKTWSGGHVGISRRIQPGASAGADFAVCWHFPNTGLEGRCPDANTGHLYAKRFPDALAVARHLADNQAYLFENTRLWHRSWYADSSLPHWFLERTLLNVSTLATTTCHRFGTGRFWAWEGVGCCEGTCTHVWQYAHSAARLFPALERDQRQRVDLGLGFDLSNMIIMHRGENTGPAIDGQAGTVLRIYREHQMSADHTFLKKNWPNIRRATDWLLRHDANGDGLVDGQQDHTLDAAWYGDIAWISGLCLAAFRAGEEMALEAGDGDFARRCREKFEKGRQSLEKQLFNGEYFIHRPDPEKGRRTLGSYNTCHIDQVFGQSWAWQLGLGRIIDRDKTLSALRSLWKYNFMPDVGPYLAERRGWRPYALAGDGGMVMNTNPQNEAKPWGDEVTWQAGYFAECMSGFEHQVASHFMAEGMIDEALVLTRCIHDRYHASKRNPFNEIECSDHYARAMASHGTYLTACGFRAHGPHGFLAFAPQWGAADFQAAFTAAGGWGVFKQKTDENGRFQADISLRFGKIVLQQLALDLPDALGVAPQIKVFKGTKPVAVRLEKKTQWRLIFDAAFVLTAGDTVTVYSNG